MLETNTGAVKAMANYPTFDPAKYQQVSRRHGIQNYSVASPNRAGFITKILTVAAAIHKGAISADTSYYDPGNWTDRWCPGTKRGGGYGHGNADHKKSAEPFTQDGRNLDTYATGWWN